MAGKGPDVQHEIGYDEAIYRKHLESFAVPMSVGMQRRYVYFDGERKFDNQTVPGLRYIYEDAKLDGTFENSNFMPRLMSLWSDIFRKVEEAQLSRERNFIAAIENYLSDYSPDEIAEIKSAISGPQTNDTSQKIITFYESILINKQLMSTISENLKINDFKKAFDEAIMEMKNTFIIPQTEQEATELTRVLYQNVIQKLSNNIADGDISSRILKIKNSNSILDMFKNFGYIRDKNFKGKPSQIAKFLMDKNNMTMDFNKFTSNFTGLRDEFVKMLSIELQKGGSGVVSYKGSTKGASGDYQKTDIGIVLKRSSNNKGTPILQKFNVSLKAATTIQNKGEDFTLPAKLAGKASLATRYQNIRDAMNLSPAGPEVSSARRLDLNALFTVINNEIIMRDTVLRIEEIEDILSYISFKWMFNLEDFQEISNFGNGGNSSGTINLFSIGKQIIPASVIYRIIRENIQAEVRNDLPIVEVNINPPTKKLAFNYYKEKNFEEIRAQSRKGSNKYYSWNNVRDWVEKEGKMGVYLKSNRLKKILDLKL